MAIELILKEYQNIISQKRQKVLYQGLHQ